MDARCHSSTAGPVEASQHWHAPLVRIKNGAYVTDKFGNALGGLRTPAAARPDRHADRHRQYRHQPALLPARHHHAAVRDPAGRALSEPRDYVLAVERAAINGVQQPGSCCPPTRCRSTRTAAASQVGLPPRQAEPGSRSALVTDPRNVKTRAAGQRRISRVIGSPARQHEKPRNAEGKFPSAALEVVVRRPASVGPGPRSRGGEAGEQLRQLGEQTRRRDHHPPQTGRLRQRARLRRRTPAAARQPTRPDPVESRRRSPRPSTAARSPAPPRPRAPEAVRDKARAGEHMEAFFGCLYYAALRPAEAVALARTRLRPARPPGGAGSTWPPHTLRRDRMDRRRRQPRGTRPQAPRRRRDPQHPHPARPGRHAPRPPRPLRHRPRRAPGTLYARRPGRHE